ncbi:DUF484 family protein [Parahaliea mediterranea]|uniref:DUF484 family protein n=1 Tax=Parahaliea mediterranea TaxID=651086 RepID=A0A939DHK5_9GAMM|nr:DUF484 family protein [Parahaliea mediterranea]MBN7798234.1 DUF484 family protein [Parahaliea mediterranea]
MSASNDAVARSGTALDEEQVREYLKNNSDFLQRHPDLLDFLHVSHASGSAVSLVEKQVSVLRERNMEMRHRLNALTANARDNDKLYEHTRKLVLKLLEASDLDQLCHSFLQGMREDFAVEYASIILFGDPDDSGGSTRYETPEKLKLEVGGLLKGRKPLCGALRGEELAFLFPNASGAGAPGSGSAAVMPLGATDKRGLIAVGSADANRYHAGMGTLFLLYLGEVIVRLLDRLPATADND